MKFSTLLVSTLSTCQAFSTATSYYNRHSTVLSATATTSSYGTKVVGESGTESFRLEFNNEDKVISPWHDIPLTSDGGQTFNMVRA
jgi:hypothetical protein